MRTGRGGAKQYSPMAATLCTSTVGRWRENNDSRPVESAGLMRSRLNPTRFMSTDVLSDTALRTITHHIDRLHDSGIGRCTQIDNNFAATSSLHKPKTRIAIAACRRCMGSPNPQPEMIKTSATKETGLHVRDPWTAATTKFVLPTTANDRNSVSARHRIPHEILRGQRMVASPPGGRGAGAAPRAGAPHLPGTPRSNGSPYVWRRLYLRA
jgi:hypothetical protein